jgi:hypothetical protein
MIVRPGQIALLWHLTGHRAGTYHRRAALTLLRIEGGRIAEEWRVG